MDIKVLADVPTDRTEGEVEAEVKEGPDQTAEPALAADSISQLSDPVRLYLREMSNFQLLSREQEVEIAKRIEAGEDEVEAGGFTFSGDARFCNRDGRSGRGWRGRPARHLRGEPRACGRG